MGCLQHRFEGTLWFITFRQSPKISQITTNESVVVTYRPSRHDYVSISGKATIVVWFPNGPEDPDLCAIAVRVDAARYWTNPASIITYAWLYAKARLTGKRAAPSKVVDTGYVLFRRPH